MGVIRPRGMKIKKPEPVKRGPFPEKRVVKEKIPAGNVLELFRKGALTRNRYNEILIELKQKIADQHNLERTIDFSTAELVLDEEEQFHLNIKDARKIRMPQITKPIEKAEAIFRVFKEDYKSLKVLFAKLGLSNVQSLKAISDILGKYNLDYTVTSFLLKIIKKQVFPEIP